MRPFTRRSFLKQAGGAASAAAAAPMLSAGWLGVARADEKGYFESTFGITDDLCRRVLATAMSKGGDYADLYFEHTIRNWVMLEDGKVNQAYSDVALGVGIRTVKGDQVGYGFTQELTEKSMAAAAATAATIADATAQPAGRAVRARRSSRTTTRCKSSSRRCRSNRSCRWCRRVNDKCFALSPLVVKVNAGFHDEQKRSWSSPATA